MRLLVFICSIQAPQRKFLTNRAWPTIRMPQQTAMNDWLALAAIVLGEIFSPVILTPLADKDTRYRLDVLPILHSPSDGAY